MSVNTSAARVVTGMPDHEYRAVPAVSQTALKRILDCPARYKWALDHPEPPRDAFDFGHVVHAMILDRGSEIARLDFPDRRTNAYRDAVKIARAAGQVPLLAAHYDQARACADAVLAHPFASQLLSLPGDSEVALFWTDPDTGIDCKALIDRAGELPNGGRLLIDVKTTASSADPDGFAAGSARYGYHVQAAFYTDAWRRITGEDDVRFLFVVVEKDAPHLVSIDEYDDDSTAAGRARYRDALTTLATCQRNDTWPGYTDQIIRTIRLPRWALTEGDTP